MRLPLIFTLAVLVINALADWYICRIVRQRSTAHRQLWRRVAVWSSVGLALFLIAAILWPKKSTGDSQLVGLMWLLYAYFSIYIPKYIFIIFDAIGRIPQLWRAKRIRICTWTGIALGILSFCLMWWGALINRYQTDVREVSFARADVPEAFDGFRIAQISDLHTGSFGTDTAFVSKLVDRVNALNPDLIVFTGDIVNRRSDELMPFVSALGRLSAPHGVYSILGNHDYGDYYQWPSAEAKAANLQLLKDLQARMGWRMLNNDTEMIYMGSDSLALIGVENIGDPPFHIYGDLDRAYRGDLADPTFKILLSHNPAHWTADIADSPDKNIALTMAGHTHAMQIELFGASPSAWRYPTWGGMYADADSAHHLYVNIGAGEVAIPARIGATPEITLFTLRKAAE